MTRAALGILLCLPALAGCDLSMRRQARYDAQAPAALWPDGTASRPIPAGVVAVDDAASRASALQPASADPALLQRGRRQYEIFCVSCHGATGRGDGAVVKRGFPPPPDYALPRVKALSGQQIYGVISNGYGVMYPYADQIAPADRWAIVAYVRALQTAADQPASAVPAGVTPLEGGAVSPILTVLAGLLAGSLFLAGVTVGAGVLRLIGRLTGGTWSESNGLDRLARLSPAPVVLAVATAAGLHLWIAPSPGPAEVWRGAPLTGLRLILIGAAWLWIGWLSGRRPSQGLSGLALLIFGVSVSLAAFDMVLSLEPGWVSSAEGMALAMRMLGAALATALLVGADARDPAAARDRRDLGGLLAATLLATSYLSLMSYLIPWYGDMPDKTEWIRLRHAPGWAALIGGSIGLGAILPLPLLALAWRFGERGLRIAAGLALLGFLGQTAWLTTPPFGWLATAVAAATAAVGALLGAWALGETRGVAHAL